MGSAMQPPAHLLSGSSRGGPPPHLGYTYRVSFQFVQDGPLGIRAVLSVGDIPACLRHSELPAQSLKPTSFLPALLLAENVPRSLCGGSCLLCSGFKSICSPILSPVFSLIITPLCLSLQEETSRSFSGSSRAASFSPDPSPVIPPISFVASPGWPLFCTIE